MVPVLLANNPESLATRGTRKYQLIELTDEKQRIHLRTESSDRISGSRNNRLGLWNYLHVGTVEFHTSSIGGVLRWKC